MPLYDFRCARCGEFRARGSIKTAGAPAPCPVCGAACAKLLSAPFVGGAAGASGWLARPQGQGGRANWRHACGFGCACG
jgi:putative FmdB family regulatory protein